MRGFRQSFAPTQHVLLPSGAGSTRQWPPTKPGHRRTTGGQTHQTKPCLTARRPRPGPGPAPAASAFAASGQRAGALQPLPCQEHGDETVNRVGTCLDNSLACILGGGEGHGSPVACDRARQSPGAHGTGTAGRDRS